MKIKYIVTTVLRYDFKDQETGKEQKGVSVHYIDPGFKYDKEEEKNQDTKGMGYNKTIFDYKEFDSFPVVPGVYEFEWGIESITPGKDPKLKIQNVEYIKPVDFSAIIDAASTDSPKPQSKAAREGVEAANSQSPIKPRS